MGVILCATRGGEESEKAQVAAIELARQQGHSVVFLYVANASFLNRIAAPVVVDVEEELAAMGRFQLAQACENAAAAGVNAEAMVRHGHLQAELVVAAREVGATVIFLGSPQGTTPVFEAGALRSLAAHLQRETGAEVRVV